MLCVGRRGSTCNERVRGVSPETPVLATSGWRVFTVTKDGPEQRCFDAVLENQEGEARLQSSSQVLRSWGFC